MQLFNFHANNKVTVTLTALSAIYARRHLDRLVETGRFDALTAELRYGDPKPGGQFSAPFVELVEAFGAKMATPGFFAGDRIEVESTTMGPRIVPGFRQTFPAARRRTYYYD